MVISPHLRLSHIYLKFDCNIYTSVETYNIRVHFYLGLQNETVQTLIKLTASTPVVFELARTKDQSPILGHGWMYTLSISPIHNSDVVDEVVVSFSHPLPKIQDGRASALRRHSGTLVTWASGRPQLDPPACLVHPSVRLLGIPHL